MAGYPALSINKMPEQHVNDLQCNSSYFKYEIVRLCYISCPVLIQFMLRSWP